MFAYFISFAMGCLMVSGFLHLIQAQPSEIVYVPFVIMLVGGFLMGCASIYERSAHRTQIERLRDRTRLALRPDPRVTEEHALALYETVEVPQIRVEENG